VDRSIQLEERTIRGVVVRPATDDDSPYLAVHLREQDKAEVMASAGMEPLWAIENSRLHSRATFVVEYEGNPALIFGVSDLEGSPGEGCIWMLGTDDIQKFSRKFLRYSRKYLKELCAPYDLVTNYVDERNTVSIRWLQSLGAVFIHRHESFGVDQLPFLEFILICADL
jgi:hypothetical protein